MTGLWNQIGDVAAHFAQLDGRLIALALALHVSNHFLRSLAWRNVLAAAYPAIRIPLLGVASAYALGVALNALLPARGGDAVKIALVRARIQESSVATIASSMSVVVLFDMAAATLLVLAVCLTGSLPFAPALPHGVAPLAITAAVVALCSVVAVTLGRSRLARVIAEAVSTSLDHA